MQKKRQEEGKQTKKGEEEGCADERRRTKQTGREEDKGKWMFEGDRIEEERTGVGRTGESR